jgi:tRNA(fMet)-specific endonuclease VapC
MKSLPFDDSCVDLYADIRSKLAAAGTPIGPIDTLIAAIALTHGVTLVTHNLAEFSRVPGLKIEDWELP